MNKIKPTEFAQIGGHHKDDYVSSKWQVFIDDCPDVAQKIAAKGGYVLLFDQPWNQNVEETPQIKRVHNWKEIESILLGEKIYVATE